MKVLIACEESQAVCKAFRELGHEAYSCDIQECSGGHPEWHILGDALESIRGGQITTMDGETHDVGKWDMLIAHPPCTYLTNAGARWLHAGGDTKPGTVQTGHGSKGLLHGVLQCGLPHDCHRKSCAVLCVRASSVFPDHSAVPVRPSSLEENLLVAERPGTFAAYRCGGAGERQTVSAGERQMAKFLLGDGSEGRQRPGKGTCQDFPRHRKGYGGTVGR